MIAHEIFNQSRMDRCAKIQRAIMKNWQNTNSFAYTVRATDSVDGVSLAGLRKRYFAVGVGSELEEIPFTDMLVVFSMIEQECAALRARKPASGSEFTVRYQITTLFSDKEAVRLLSQVRIETPFDPDKLLRIQPLTNGSNALEDES